MVRAAVIGIGRIGHGLEHDRLRSKPASHVGAYLASPKTELVAVADIDKSKLDAFKQEHPEIETHTDYEVMLNREKPEIISICTPTETHCKITRNCARFASTKVIFVEKPISSTVEEAEKMVRTAKEFNIKLAVDHLRKWDSAYGRIKRIVDGKDETWNIGELLAFVGKFSGDPIGDGVHMADLALWYKGENTKINLFNVPSPYLVFEADLFGSDGIIRVTDNGGNIQLWFIAKSDKYEGFWGLSNMITLDETYDFSSAMSNAVNDLVECASSDKQPDCDGDDGINALKLCIKKTGG